MDVGQMFSNDILPCIRKNDAIPIYSLQLRNLCYLQEKSLSLGKPYMSRACHVLAQGIADKLQLQYKPFPPNSTALNLLLIANGTLQWVPFTNANFHSKTFLCLRNDHVCHMADLEADLQSAVIDYIK